MASKPHLQLNSLLNSKYNCVKTSSTEHHCPSSLDPNDLPEAKLICKLKICFIRCNKINMRSINKCIDNLKNNNKNQQWIVASKSSIIASNRSRQQNTIKKQKTNTIRMNIGCFAHCLFIYFICIFHLLSFVFSTSFQFAILMEWISCAYLIKFEQNRKKNETWKKNNTEEEKRTKTSEEKKKWLLLIKISFVRLFACSFVRVSRLRHSTPVGVLFRLW